MAKAQVKEKALIWHTKKAKQGSSKWSQDQPTQDKDLGHCNIAIVYKICV